MANKLLLKRSLTFASLPVISLITLVSCSAPELSGEAQQQKQIILNNYQSLENNLLWDSILEYQYKNDDENFKVSEAFKDKNSKFYKDAWEAFDYYQTVSLKSDPVFFIQKISQWASLGALSQDGTAESNLETNQKLSLNYGQELTPQQFDLIWTNTKTGIQEQVKKMLIVKEYLTNAKEADIKNSTEYKDATANTSISNIYNNVLTKQKDFFLNISLLKDQIADVWEYNDSNAIEIATYSRYRISNYEDFNVLSQSKQSLVNQRQDSKIALNTNDSIDTSKLFSYKGLQKDKSGSGDMDYSINTLKKQYLTKAGWLDNTTSKIHSTNDLNKATFFNGKNEVSLTLKEESKTKTKFNITKEDFNLNTTSMDADIDYEISALYPDFNLNSVEKVINVVIKMTSKQNTLWVHFYSINVDWRNETIVYTPATDQKVNGYVSSLSVQSSDGKAIKMSYINKIVPLADEVVITGEGDNRKINAYFTLNNTPWSTDKQKTLLAFALVTLNDSYLNSALKFFEDLGFKVIDKNTKIFS
ncbi:hypothetical protein NV226_00070 [Mycoplasma iguanae]|uniref:P60-like lipoprotein n=1 Tax=Mycoplasma iguanae TaxID=292461 RepID=A0ABY5RAR1_9MOLU|nr:hypothetical protein [Mycoplasma iguanae]UVD81705.1 hypothetical protein NV226_00070 [Mycoplasma iguanae]